ncbi:MAG: signal recognition particle protein [Pseudomonadota bacterium]|nr:signal recognition particle protein [Pseudomonadota bacterium]
MFETLSTKFAAALSAISPKSTLSEDNIKKVVKDIRVGLLEADVALSVIDEFISKVKSRAIGRKVSKELSASQEFLKIVKEELTNLMGGESTNLDLASQPPVVVLVAGLQGVGKTTTVGKLAALLREREKKSVLVASTDVQRPAAIEQLELLASQGKVDFFPSNQAQSPVEIARLSLTQAKTQFKDVLIIDTAGRLSVDQGMMQELKDIHSVLKPKETLFVVDALTGQDAALTAKAFDNELALTGLILSKIDSDSRGGAALSAKAVTGKPIKFIANGESLDSIEHFHAERMASRILGMGDVLSLIEEVERKVDPKKASRIASKFKKGNKFDLEDFKEQIQQMNNLGGIGKMLEKLPISGLMKEGAQEKIERNKFGQMIVIIDSMTPKERHFPDKINGSRKRRIASGSGTTVQDISRLLKQFKQMQKMTKKLGNRGRFANAIKEIGSFDR